MPAQSDTPKPTGLCHAHMMPNPSEYAPITPPDTPKKSPKCTENQSYRSPAFKEPLVQHEISHETQPYARSDDGSIKQHHIVSGSETTDVRHRMLALSSNTLFAPISPRLPSKPVSHLRHPPQSTYSEEKYEQTISRVQKGRKYDAYTTDSNVPAKNIPFALQDPPKPKHKSRTHEGSASSSSSDDSPEARDISRFSAESDKQEAFIVRKTLPGYFEPQYNVSSNLESGSAAKRLACPESPSLSSLKRSSSVLCHESVDDSEPVPKSPRYVSSRHSLNTERLLSCVDTDRSRQRDSPLPPTPILARIDEHADDSYFVFPPDVRKNTINEYIISSDTPLSPRRVPPHNPLSPVIRKRQAEFIGMNAASDARLLREQLNAESRKTNECEGYSLIYEKAAYRNILPKDDYASHNQRETESYVHGSPLHYHRSASYADSYDAEKQRTSAAKRSLQQYNRSISEQSPNKLRPISIRCSPEKDGVSEYECMTSPRRFELKYLDDRGQVCDAIPSMRYRLRDGSEFGHHDFQRVRDDEIQQSRYQLSRQASGVYDELTISPNRYHRIVQQEIMEDVQQPSCVRKLAFSNRPEDPPFDVFLLPREGRRSQSPPLQEKITTRLNRDFQLWSSPSRRSPEADVACTSCGRDCPSVAASGSRGGVKIRDNPCMDVHIQCASISNDLRELQHKPNSHCNCAGVHKEILQMAKDAFSKVRRRNDSQADFNRFHGELAEQHKVLLDSLKICKTLESMCKHGRKVKDVYEGSVVIRLSCPTLVSLEDLWNMYQSRELENILYKAFITDSLKNKFHASDIQLTVTLCHEQYHICRRWLENSLDDDPLFQRMIQTEKDHEKENRMRHIHVRSSSSPVKTTAPPTSNICDVTDAMSPIRKNLSMDDILARTPVNILNSYMDQVPTSPTRKHLESISLSECKTSPSTRHFIQSPEYEVKINQRTRTFSK